MIQVLPLENKMKSPRYAKRIIFLGMVVVMFIFIEFGTLGYVVYGEKIQPSISLNLASKNTAETMLVEKHSKVIIIIVVLQKLIPPAL